MVTNILPQLPGVYLEFLRLLTDEGQMNSAERIWSQLIGLRQPFDPQKATPYLENLITDHQIDKAKTAWNELGGVDPSFRPHLTSAGNLMVNSGFEEKLFNMGFDWRYENRSHVTLGLDRDQFHGGSRSLSIAFDGDAVTDTGLSQRVAVDPNTQYSFNAYVKTDNIFTAQGPRFVIGDAYTPALPLLVTEELLGTSDWRRVGGSFKTGPGTDLVSLKMIRPAGAAQITGRLWVDDVVMVRE
jgi:hypothetical protein